MVWRRGGPRTTTTAEGDANNCASERRRPCVHRANPRANLAHRLRVHRCHLFDHLSIPPPLASPLHTHQEHPTSFAFVSVSRGDHHRWRYRTDRRLRSFHFDHQQNDRWKELRGPQKRRERKQSALKRHRNCRRVNRGGGVS